MITTNILERQAEQRKKLLSLIERGEVLFSGLNHPKIQEIGELRNKILNENLHVVVLGSFKRGKSTFINALLGEEILPSYATPCTAVINEVKWGEQKKAVVHFRSPGPKVSLKKISFASLPEKAKEHLKRSGRIRFDPLEIGIDELEDYVVIKNQEDDSLESINDLPYDHVEIFWPLPLLKNGVVIIDSPGLDECESRTKITERYLGKADAILFVQSCTALAGQSEMDFIENVLIDNGYEDMLFICNRFDQIRDEKERQRIMSYGREKLGDKTNFGSENGVFFLSASEALEGRLQNDRQRFIDSGLADLERRLNTMLVSSRGKTKLIQPTRFLAQELSGSIDDLHTKRSDSQERVQDLRYRLKEFQRHAEREIVNIHKTLEKLRRDLTKIVQGAKESIDSVYQNYFVAQTVQAIIDHVPSESIGLSYFFSEKDVRKKRILEIASKIQRSIRSFFESNQHEMNNWLQELCKEKNAEAEDYISLAVERVVDSIHRFQAALDDENDQVEASADFSSIRLNSIPKLSDAASFSQSHRQTDVQKLLKNVGINETRLHERSLESFFFLPTESHHSGGAYYNNVNESNMDRLLTNAGFPYDDASKDTDELKLTIGTYLCNNLVERKDSLLEPHTRGWEREVESFLNTLCLRIEQRLEEIKELAADRNRELFGWQEELRLSEEQFKEIRSIHASLDDLIYDLAIS